MSYNFGTPRVRFRLRSDFQTVLDVVGNESAANNDIVANIYLKEAKRNVWSLTPDGRIMNCATHQCLSLSESKNVVASDVRDMDKYQFWKFKNGRIILEATNEILTIKRPRQGPIFYLKVQQNKEDNDQIWDKDSIGGNYYQPKPKVQTQPSYHQQNMVTSPPEQDPPPYRPDEGQLPPPSNPHFQFHFNQQHTYQQQPAHQYQQSMNPHEKQQYKPPVPPPFQSQSQQSDFQQQSGQNYQYSHQLSQPQYQQSPHQYQKEQNNQNSGYPEPPNLRDVPFVDQSQPQSHPQYQPQIQLKQKDGSSGYFYIYTSSNHQPAVFTLFERRKHWPKVILTPKQPSNDKQLWKFENGYIVSKYNNYVLTTDHGMKPSPVIARTPANAQDQKWSYNRGVIESMVPTFCLSYRGQDVVVDRNYGNQQHFGVEPLKSVLNVH